MEQRMALVGLPNAGKSTLFNALSGLKQRQANFAGVTVCAKEGTFERDGQEYVIYDLPGLYSLDVYGLEEKISRDIILNKKDLNLNGVILIIDATQLKRGLYLALQLIELEIPFVVALNMWDVFEAKQGRLDLSKLAEYLKAPIIPISALHQHGFDQLKTDMDRLKDFQLNPVIPHHYQSLMKSDDYVAKKLKLVDEILKETVIQAPKRELMTEKLDRFLLHPVWGILTLSLTLILMFQLLFVGAEPFMEIIESLFNWLSQSASHALPDGLLKDLIVDGILAGVGGVIIFVPHIFLLYLMISFLEEAGYLGRAAFLLDYLMRKVGLPGRAVIPMLSSHACAIPGIMSARIIADPWQRWMTMLVAPLTSCSARLPVYTLLIAATIPDRNFMGLGLPALTLALLYFMGMSSAFLVAWIGKKFAIRQAPTYLLMELPAYRMPVLFGVFKTALDKAWLFIKKAGTVILLLSVIIWALVTFPKAPDNAPKAAIEYSAAAKIGQFIAPVFAPLGFDWKMTTALIPSMAAREVMVSAMATVLSIEDENEEVMLTSLKDQLASRYSLATLLSLLVWFVYAPQCIATYGVLKKEGGSHKLPLIFMAYTLSFAYVMSLLTYLLFS